MVKEGVWFLLETGVRWLRKATHVRDRGAPACRSHSTCKSAFVCEVDLPSTHGKLRGKFCPEFYVHFRVSCKRTQSQAKQNQDFIYLKYSWLLRQAFQRERGNSKHLGAGAADANWERRPGLLQGKGRGVLAQRAAPRRLVNWCVKQRITSQTTRGKGQRNRSRRAWGTMQMVT